MTDGTSSRNKNFYYENVEINEHMFVGIYDSNDSSVPVALAYDAVFAAKITDVLNDYYANKFFSDEAEVIVERCLKSLFTKGTLDVF